MRVKRVCLILLFLYEVNSYSSYVPQTACFDMMPNHQAIPQLTASPYSIIASKNYFDINDTITGELFFFKDGFIIDFKNFVVISYISWYSAISVFWVSIASKTD